MVKPEEIDHSGDLSVDGWIINISIVETGYESVDMIQLVQGRVQWQALVSTILNIRVPYGKCLDQFGDYQFSRKILLHGVGYPGAEMWSLLGKNPCKIIIVFIQDTSRLFWFQRVDYKHFINAVMRV
jgi:hypothetical protein